MSIRPVKRTVQPQPTLEAPGRPVAWYGPIVMSIEAGIEEAVHELRTGPFVRQTGCQTLRICHHFTHRRWSNGVSLQKV